MSLDEGCYAAEINKTQLDAMKIIVSHLLAVEELRLGADKVDHTFKGAVGVINGLTPVAAVTKEEFDQSLQKEHGSARGT